MYKCPISIFIFKRSWVAGCIYLLFTCFLFFPKCALQKDLNKTLTTLKNGEKAEKNLQHPEQKLGKENKDLEIKNL